MTVAFKRIADAVRRTHGCVVSNAIEACVASGMGVGIVACKDIPKDTLVFQAGYDAWYRFSAEYALETAQQKAPDFVAQWNQLLSSNKSLRDGSVFVPSALVLGVHMLVNFPLAKESSATLETITNTNALLLDKLYVNALPRSINLPLVWNDRQFKELQGCEEARRIMQYGKRFYTQMYHYFFGSNNQFIHREAFFRAIMILMSRATSGQNQPFTLVPFFDWFNHANNGNECVQDFDPHKGFTVHTTKSYERGEQLFISYGNHANLRLLRNYGFTIPANPYEVVNLPMPGPLQQLNPTDPAFSQKRQLLSAAGSQTDLPVLKSLALQHNGNIDPYAEHWLTIMLATPEELSKILTHATMPPRTGAYVTWLRQIPLSLTRKVSVEVRNLVTRRMKEHCSTFEEDDAFLRVNEQQMAPWLRSCLQLRMGEKQTLIQAAAVYST